MKDFSFNNVRYEKPTDKLNLKNAPVSIESIIGKQLQKYKAKEINFKQACHNIDSESDSYKLVCYSEEEVVFESIKTKRRLKIQNYVS